MAYRDDKAPLEERYESLSKALDEVRSQSRALSSQEAQLASELEAVRTRLEPDRRHLPLANVRIASPCPASWEAMTGDDRTRLCGDCNKHVHDLTKMTRHEVDAFLHAHSDGACVRLFQRTDGRLITEDCPVGMRRRRTRALAASMLGAGACALLGFTAIARVMTSEISPIEVRPVTPIYVPAPVTPPVAQQPPAQNNALSGSGSASDTISMGFIWVEAPEGTRVFEGDHFLGTAPLMVPMEEGLHVFRAIDPKTGKPKAAFGNVRPRDVTTVVVDFDAKTPKVERKRLMMGEMSSDPTGTTNTL